MASGASNRGNHKPGLSQVLLSRAQSFGYAARGIRILLTKHTNLQIQVAIGVVTVILGLVVSLERWQWCAVIIASMVVLVAEGLNSSLEYLCNVVSPEQNSLIGQAKDVAAGAVLLAAIGAVVVGLLVFLST